MIRRCMLFILVFLISLPAIAQMKTSRTIIHKPAVQVPPPPLEPGQPAPEAVAETAEEQIDDAANASNASSPPPSQCDGMNLSGHFPVGRSSKAAECFWDQNGFQLLKNAQMVSSNGSVAAATEMMSDFFYGWRFNFSSAVASQGDDDEPDDGTAATGTTTNDNGSSGEDAAVNLLQANGGNLALSAAYPLYAKAFGGNGDGTAGFVAITYGRLAGTFDAFGNDGGNGESLDFKDLNANAEWAVTTQTKLVTMSESFDFELYTNTGLLAGTKTFRNAVGIKPKNAGAFLHAEVGANVRIAGKMLIGASWNYYSADGLDGGATLTVGFGR